MGPRPATVNRLDPAYYEQARLPGRFAALASVPDTLPAGSPAKVGILDLAFERMGGRTELVGRYQKTPLQIMRPLYIDPHLPEMAFVYVMATGGGVAQADRYRMDLRCGANTQVHVTTQAATKVYGMEHDYATQSVRVEAGAGSFVEYLPDPLIPFAEARFHQHTQVTVADDATVLLGETITAGRLARGERHAYRILATDLEVRRPDGRLLLVDTLRLDAGAAFGPAVLAGHDHVSSFFVITAGKPPGELADTLHTALAEYELPYGVSVLPHDCGAWVRVLGDSPPRVADAGRAAWDATRRLLTGHPAPDLRKP